jgi:phospholipid N-methyltransferase
MMTGCEHQDIPVNPMHDSAARLSTRRISMSRFIRSSTAIALAGVLAAAAINVESKDRRECDRDYKPQVGQSGKDVVWVPTPDEIVQRMLRLAKVTAQDTVYDLGAGDGKIAIAAGKIGATSVGIEYNPDMAKLAQCYVQAENLEGKTRIIQGDVFKEDFSKASVITMYLLPELNLKLRPTILNMKPGTRVTSHQFTMGDWEPDETAEVDYRTAYLWIVPAKVDGTWTVREQGSTNAYTVNLNQKYQKITGDVAAGSAKQPLVGATVRGEEVRFAFNDDKGVTRTLTGTVRGNELTGSLKGAGGAETKVTGTRK